MQFPNTNLIVRKMLFRCLILVGYNLVILLKSFIICFKLTCLVSLEIFKLLNYLIELIIFDLQGTWNSLELLAQQSYLTFILCPFPQQFIILSLNLVDILFIGGHSVPHFTFILVYLPLHCLYITLVLSYFTMCSIQLIIFSVYYLL